MSMETEEDVAVGTGWTITGENDLLVRSPSSKSVTTTLAPDGQADRCHEFQICC